MTFDARWLTDFLAVVDHGSLGRAANAIHTTQPALSRRLRELEDRLGVRLFDRHAKGMAPTLFGEALVPHARLLAFEMGQAVETLDALRGLHRGRLRIGSIAAVVRTILPAALRALLEAHPGLEVELLEAGNDQLTISLLNNTLDMIIAGDLTDEEGIALIAECNFEDRYQVFCSAEHPLCANTSCTLDDVLTERWVLPGKGSPHRTLFEQVIQGLEQIMPQIPIATASTSAIIAIVKKTRYLGWLPQSLLHRDQSVDDIKVLDISALSLKRRFFVYRRSKGLLPPAAGHLIRQLVSLGLVTEKYPGTT